MGAGAEAIPSNPHLNLHWTPRLQEQTILIDAWLLLTGYFGQPRARLNYGKTEIVSY